MITTHNFEASLAFSHAQEDEPWWEQIYREAFPTMATWHSTRNDGWAQRGGIDRLIVLRDGTTLKIDEKARREDWTDILIEYWSDEARRIPGWGHPNKELTCDYIAYAMVPSQTCYLLPYQILRRVIKRDGRRWWDLATHKQQGFDWIPARNRDGPRTWTTRSVAVPTEILLDAIRDCLIVRWKTSDEELPS